MTFKNIEIDYYIREKSIHDIGVSLSLLKILSFSVKAILLVDKTLSERNGVTVFQNFS